MAHQASVAPIPLLYRLFFLWIEPIATAVGAYYAHYQQEQYMHLTYDAFPLFADKLTALAGSVSTRESIVLTQLANMYLVFALNEALVLRASTDLRVWKVLLLGLLIADFGHLYSVKSAGLEVYWQFWHWNSIYWVSECTA